MESLPKIYENDGQIRILFVEDDEDDFFSARDLISNIPGSERWKVDWCPSCLEAITHFSRRYYDVYFVDFYLNGMTGLDLLREAKKMEFAEPIILLTGRASRHMDVDVMHAGAFDYLVKHELTEEKLERAIRYAMEKAKSIRILRSNEQKYRNIFEQSIDAIFLLNEDLSFRTVNHSTCRLLQYTEKELQEMTLGDVLTDDIQLTDILRQYERNGEVGEMEVSVFCSDGKEKICLLSASTVEVADNVKLIQGIMHDITQIRRSKDSTMVVEKMATANRLLQTLAHEIRNPLANISLSADQLVKTNDNGMMKQYVDIILRNNDRINTMLSRLIHSSRPSELVMNPVDIQMILNEAVSALADQLALKRIKLNLKFGPDPITVCADRVQLGIAFQNIIMNSIEAMEDGEGILVVSAYNNEIFCEVRITDNGCGISEENRKKLFEPYFTSKKSSLGMGLPIALNILQGHAAGIDVVSVEGTGTTFSISIPIERNFELFKQLGEPKTL